MAIGHHQSIGLSSEFSRAKRGVAYISQGMFSSECARVWLKLSSPTKKKKKKTKKIRMGSKVYAYLLSLALLGQFTVPRIVNNVP